MNCVNRNIAASNDCCRRPAQGRSAWSCGYVIRVADDPSPRTYPRCAQALIVLASSAFQQQQRSCPHRFGWVLIASLRASIRVAVHAISSPSFSSGQKADGPCTPTSQTMSRSSIRKTTSAAKAECDVTAGKRALHGGEYSAADEQPMRLRSTGNASLASMNRSQISIGRRYIWWNITRMSSVTGALA